MTSINLCPQCGGILDKKMSGGVFVDEKVFDVEGILLQGCLCFYSSGSLARALEGFEMAFTELLKEFFPGKTKNEIIKEVQQMENGIPLKSRVRRGFSVLNRAKARLSEIKKQESKKEEETERAFHERKVGGMKGEPVSVKNWFCAGSPKY